MSVPARSPFALLRFAVREADWPLAALLAARLGRTARGRRRVERELSAARALGLPAPSRFGLQVLARLIRFYARG